MSTTSSRYVRLITTKSGNECVRLMAHNWICVGALQPGYRSRARRPTIHWMDCPDCQNRSYAEPRVEKHLQHQERERVVNVGSTHSSVCHYLNYIRCHLPA
jgi:hypothetical protein